MPERARSNGWARAGGILLALGCGPRPGAGATLPAAVGPQTSADSPAAPPRWVTVERIRCYPSCPTYRVTLRADGNVEFEGLTQVHTRGRATKTLPVPVATSLLVEFHRLAVLRSAPACPKPANASVSHSRRLFVTLDGSAETQTRICNSEPFDPARAAVRRLERAVDIDAWIGSEYPCEQFGEALYFEANRADGGVIGDAADSSAKFSQSAADWARGEVGSFNRWGHAAVPGFRVRIAGSRSAEEPTALARRRAEAGRALLTNAGLDPSVLQIASEATGTTGSAGARKVEFFVDMPGCDGTVEFTTAAQPRRRANAGRLAPSARPPRDDDGSGPGCAEDPRAGAATPPPHNAEQDSPAAAPVPSPSDTLGKPCSPCDMSCSTGQICGDDDTCVDGACLDDDDCPSSFICDASSRQCATCCLPAEPDVE